MNDMRLNRDTLDNVTIKELRQFVAAADFLTIHPGSKNQEVALHLGISETDYSRLIETLQHQTRQTLLGRTMVLEGHVLVEGLRKDEVEIAKRTFPDATIERRSRLTKTGISTAAAAKAFLDMLDCAQWWDRPISKIIPTFDLTADNARSHATVFNKPYRPKDPKVPPARPWDYRSSGYRDPTKEWPRHIPNHWKNSALADLPTPSVTNPLPYQP